LFWRTNAGNHNLKAVRRGDWKYVLDGNTPMVFNVRKDLGERDDSTNSQQAVARELRALLAAWERDVDAEAKANGTVGFNTGTGQGRGAGAGARGRGGAPPAAATSPD
jgi:arylsulfatase A-like enzyme